MSSLSGILQHILSEETSNKPKFPADDEDEKFGDDLQEWDELSFDYLAGSCKSFDSYSYRMDSDKDSSFASDPLWDLDEIINAELNLHKSEFSGIPGEIARWLLSDTWNNRTNQCQTFLVDLLTFIERLDAYSRLIKALACAAVLEMYRVPRQIDAMSRYIRDNSHQASENALVSLKDNLDRAYESYENGGLPMGFKRLYHDTLYKAAKRCGVLPSGLYVDNAQQTSIMHVAGGGFADVYKGLTKNGQVIALKVPRNFAAAEWIRRVHAEICKEALVWNLSRHPNVLPLLGVVTPQITFDDNPSPIALISPWMENGSLRQYLSTHPRANKCEILSGILCGLVYLHCDRTPPVVHGDLRCDNILVNNEGMPCIADFGLSRVEAIQATLTATSTARGSLRWQAPELLLPETYGGTGKQTPETDVYAFGMTCLEIYTGKVPFNNLSDAQAVLAISQGRVPDKPDLTPAELPCWMWDMMKDCWDSDRDRRPSARILWIACDGCMS